MPTLAQRAPYPCKYQALSPPHHCSKRREAIFGASPAIHRARREPWDSSPPPAAPAAGGWGSPAPACKYGRVGWEARRRRSGGGGAAGGWFWSRRVLLRWWRSSELPVCALDWLDLEARRGARDPLLSVRSEVVVDLAADGSSSASSSGGGFDGGCGKRCGRVKGALPRPFIVNNSGAARRRVKAASSIGKKLSLTAARWWLAAFDSDAGDGVFFDLWSISPTYFVLVFPTVYVVCGMC